MLWTDPVPLSIHRHMAQAVSCCWCPSRDWVDWWEWVSTGLDFHHQLCKRDQFIVVGFVVTAVPWPHAGRQAAEITQKWRCCYSAFCCLSQNWLLSLSVFEPRDCVCVCLHQTVCLCWCTRRRRRGRRRAAATRRGSVWHWRYVRPQEISSAGFSQLFSVAASHLRLSTAVMRLLSHVQGGRPNNVNATWMGKDSRWVTVDCISGGVLLKTLQDSMIITHKNSIKQRGTGVQAENNQQQ